MIGIESIKTLLDYGFSFGFRVKEVVADDSPGGKKVTLTEIVGSLDLLFKIPAIVAQAPLAYEQWQDIDEDEAKELKQHFADKFDIADDKIEAVTEEVWGILLHLGNLIDLLDKD
jgi:hypothetical protein